MVPSLKGVGRMDHILKDIAKERSQAAEEQAHVQKC